MRDAFIAKSGEAKARSQPAGVRDLASLTSPAVQQQALDARREMLKAIERAQSANGKFREERFRLARERLAFDHLHVITAIPEMTPPN